MGSGKEISSVLKSLDSRKGCEVKISAGKRSYLLTSCLERELHKLECIVNICPCFTKRKGRIDRSSTILF